MNKVTLTFANASDAKEFAQLASERLGTRTGQILEVLGHQVCEAVSVELSNPRSTQARSKELASYLKALALHDKGQFIAATKQLQSAIPGMGIGAAVRCLRSDLETVKAFIGSGQFLKNWK